VNRAAPSPLARTVWVAIAGLLALIPLGGPADAQARRQAVLMSESERGREFQERWGFSAAVVTGDTIHLRGGITEIKVTARKPAAPQGK